MKTGTCLRPSWTAIVWPTISGKIVEVRDQVRTMFLDPESFIASMRLISRSSTYGPFLADLLTALPPNFDRVDRSFQTAERAKPPRPERDIASDVSSLLLAPAALPDDQTIGFLVLAAGSAGGRRPAAQPGGVARAPRLAL